MVGKFKRENTKRLLNIAATVQHFLYKRHKELVFLL